MITTDQARVTYTGAGTRGPFAIPYYFLDNGDLHVVVTVIATGVETVLDEVTDWTATGEGVEAGGTLMLTVGYGNLASTHRITIINDLAATQPVRYPPNDKFPAKTHERALDRLTMLVLRLKDRISRSLRLSEGYDGEIPTIPPPVAGGYWRWTSSLTLEFTSAIIDAGNFLLDQTGAVTRTVVDKLSDLIHGKDFGMIADAVLDGVNFVSGTDNAVALNRLFACPGRVVHLPPGVIYYNSDLDQPVCAAIIGEGEYATTLLPGPGVVNPLRLVYPVTRAWDFGINGVLTGAANLGGIIWGGVDANSAGAMDAGNIRVSNFSGNDAIGMVWDCMLKSAFNRTTAEGCTLNYHVRGNNSFPTTITFNNMISASGPGGALRITTGFDLTFNDFMADSSLGPSIIILPGDDQEANRIVFNRPRFENDTALTDPDPNFNFDIVVDGSGTGTCKAIIEINSPKFAYAARGALNVFGAHAYVYLTDPQGAFGAGSMEVNESALLDCPKWPSTLLAASFIVADNVKPTFPLLGFNCPDANAVEWTPTVSSNIGDEAATFDGTVTITRHRFKHAGGKWAKFQIEFVGTLDTTPTGIRFSMPGGMMALHDEPWVSAPFKHAGTWTTGMVRGHSAGYLEIGLVSAAAMSVGDVAGEIDILVELA
jgi:hypothetical protein